MLNGEGAVPDRSRGSHLGNQRASTCEEESSLLRQRDMGATAAANTGVLS